MTKSQSKIQMFFRDHPFLVFLAGLVALLLITAGVATAIKGVLGSQHATATSSPSGTSQPNGASASPQPSETPVSTHGPDTNTGDETAGTLDTSCKITQNPEQYAHLTDRILAYEEARLQPNFSDDQVTMRVYATDIYVASHSNGTKQDTPGSDVLVSLDRSQTVVDCHTLSDSRVIVQTLDVISTYRVDISGNHILVNQFTNPLTAHVTGWVIQKGDWYVDSEQS